MCQLEAFTCALYGSACVQSINQLRYALFSAKRGKIESHQLPPCRDSLKNHARRANYQALVWKRCLEQFQTIPEPEDHGWSCHNGVLSMDWMNGLPAPESVLNLLSCECSRRCNKESCPCIQNGLLCTDMCRLKDCDNRKYESNFGCNESDIESDEEEDDDV